MIRHKSRWAWGVSLALTGAVYAGNVTVDRTVGAVRAGERLEGPTFGLDDDAGKRAGQNLLISLQNFDLDPGETAIFFSSQPTRNIITRVTGGSASTINGTVVSQVPGASLFIINPSGLVIGEGARFEVNGALHLSSAQQLQMSDGATLDTRGGAVPTLSTADPRAFGFLTTPATVSLRGATIAPPQGDLTRNVYSITGGQIHLSNVQVQALGSTFAIHSGGSAGTVTVPTLDDAGTASFSLPGLAAITGSSTIEAKEGGSVRVTGGNVFLKHSRIDTSVNAVNGGAVELLGSNLVYITDSAAILTGTEGVGASSPVTVRAPNIVLSTRSVIASQLLPPIEGGTPGRGGAITLRGDFIDIASNGRVVSSNGSTASGSDVTIDATRSLTLRGQPESTVSLITGAQAETVGAGTGGNITIRSPQISFTRSAEVQSRTIATGNAGDVTVVGGNMTLDAEGFGFTGLGSRAGDASTGGSGGRVRVELTGDLSIRRGGAITATTFGPGNGGSVFIRAQNVVASDVGAGNIDEVTGQPFNGVFARSARTDARGNFIDGGLAGSVTLEARDRVLIANGSSVGAESYSTTNGAGNVTISAPFIRIDNASVTVRSDQTDGGNLTLSGDTVLVSNGSNVNAFAQQDGGRLFIQPARVVAIGGASVLDAQSNGGAVLTVIDPTASFLLSNDSTILATNPVLPPELDVVSGLLQFHVTTLDITRQLQPDCAQQTFGNVSTFTLEPRGGVRGER